MEQTRQLQESSLPRKTFQQDDEIDLKELLIALWKGKWIIIIATVVCAVGAVTYALLAKQVWTTDATVTAPQISEFSHYQEMVSDFKPFFGSVNGQSSLNNFTDPKQLLSVFMQQYQSSVNKKTFILAWPAFKNALNQAQLDDKSPEVKAKLLTKWMEKLSSSYMKDVSHSDMPSFSLKATQASAQESLDFLVGYIEYVESKSRAALIKNLYSIVDAKRQELGQSKRLLVSDAKSELKNQLLLSQYALDIAKAAGVDKPQQNLVGQEMFAINIGANALEAKVKVLKGLKQLSLIKPRLQSVESQLDLLNDQTVDKNVQFSTFQYVESPEAPLSRTSPKRALIAILGVLLGGMLGCAIVLIRHAFREK